MDSADAPAANRNLVICCDGTSNEIGVTISNVLKLYRIAEKNEAQRVFYDPGVGTIGQLAAWGRLWQQFRNVLGLATGFGLDDNILDAYRWLCLNYRSGDRIFLFGFSRGAYTVRALAGLINMIGLLTADQLNITDYALTAYKRAAEKHDLPLAWQFQRISEGRDVTIHFMGVWDTVASVLVPRPDRLYWPSLQFLPFTKQNKRVRSFRQAIAIDERRAMFRNYRWNGGQKFDERRFGSVEVDQDSGQVWFAGVHADIGGGYPEVESGLSKFPLAWMLDQAESHGLRLNHALRSHLVDGTGETGALHTYVPPNATATLHKSLTGLWWLLEVVPKRAKWLRWPKRKTFAGLYLPLAEPRFIPEDADIHPSVLERVRLMSDYRPINLPRHLLSEEMR
jgi:uncharacterized protein (DUF2235 family)